MLLDSGFAGFAAARAYFAMFYAAEALLEGEGLAFSKHSAIIAAFGHHFAKTGKLTADLHRYLIEGEAARHAGDYGGSGAVTPEQAREHIDRAREFLSEAERVL